MKVLDLINTSASAKELLLHRALYLARTHGVESQVLCMPGPHVSFLREQGLTVHELEQPRGLDPLRLTGSYRDLVTLLRSERFDIIHSHGSVLGLLTRLARYWTDARIVHTVHGFHFHEGMSRPRAAAYAAAEKVLLRLTDLTLSQNDEDARILRSWSRKAWVETIGNGIPLRDPGFQYESRLRDRYRLSCIARFEPVKNHAMLLEAFRCVLDGGIDAELVCFGEGETQSATRALARSLELADRVQFPGYVDIFAHLSDVDLNVLTSIKEGLPRALIEPMSAGVPSVATDVKGSREVVEHGVTGLLQPLGNPQSFADAVVSLLQDPARREAMSVAGIQRAHELFDEDRVCDRLFTLYQRLLAQ